MSVHRLLPVARHWLFLMAGIAWTGVGILLWSRSITWISDFPVGMEILLCSASVFISAVFYRFVFSVVVKKNIARLHALPDKVSPLAFTGGRGYAMILLMMSAGIALRASPLPKIYLSVPYASMGTVLIVGSVSFYRNFKGIGKREK